MQGDGVADIFTDRLHLERMTVAALEATKSHDLPRVAKETGLHVPPEWLELSWLADMAAAAANFSGAIPNFS